MAYDDILAVSRPYYDDPEKRRQIDAMVQGANPSNQDSRWDQTRKLIGNYMTPVVGMALKQLRDAYTLPDKLKGLVGGTVDTATLPRRVHEGKVDPLSDEAIQWGANMATAGNAPAGALAAGNKTLAAGTFWSDLAKTKHTIPVEEMRATQVPTGELQSRRIIQPSDLEGRVLIGEMGDRTQAGHRLTDIGGKPLSFDVNLEGGPNYMRAAASTGPDRGIWASDKGQVTRISNFAEREAERLGGDPVLSYTAMGARGGDFSHMMSDAVLGQIPGSKIRAKDLTAFDKEMRIKYPEWAGLRKPEELRAQLSAGGAGQMRKDFAEESALSRWAEKGFPDPGQTRFAITDPELIGKPTGASGYSFAKIDPGARPIIDPARPHTTYPTQLGGEYAGGFERTVPLDVLYPTWAREKLAAGMRPQKLDRAFQIGNVSQLADPEWVELVSRYLEQQRGRGP